jgi:hypothetical protein
MIARPGTLPVTAGPALAAVPVDLFDRLSQRIHDPHPFAPHLIDGGRCRIGDTEPAGLL